MPPTTLDLPQAIADHLDRLTTLADHAADDGEESFASRASALSALSAMLKELTKTQQQVINMENLLKTEKVIVETVKEFLSEQQLEFLIEKLDAALTEIHS